MVIIRLWVVDSPPSLEVKVKGASYACPAGKATLRAVARPKGAVKARKGTVVETHERVK